MKLAEKLLKKYGVENYTINERGETTINSSLSLNSLQTADKDFLNNIKLLNNSETFKEQVKGRPPVMAIIIIGMFVLYIIIGILMEMLK